MNADNPMRVLLGPQRPERNLDEAARVDGIPEGTIATISAGWQEAENDIDDIREVVGRPLHDLRLYGRAEELFAAEPALETAYRHRQDLLKEQQRLYRLRLRQLSNAARQMLSAEGDSDMVAAEQRHAIAQLRALDRHHLHRSEALHRKFEERFSADTSAVLARHRDEIREALDACVAVLITGGNVVVLLNRLRLFGLASMLESRHVIAWSAGAMVLGPRVVLFHDRMPGGRRDAEVLGAGLDLIPEYVFLPNADRRLRRKDRLRMGLFSRRLAPEIPTALDSGALLAMAGDKLTMAHGVRRLNHDGAFVRVREA